MRGEFHAEPFVVGAQDGRLTPRLTLGMSHQRELSIRLRPGECRRSNRVCVMVALAQLPSPLSRKNTTATNGYRNDQVFSCPPRGNGVAGRKSLRRPERYSAH